MGLQTKLKVNDPGDAYEQEAERAADVIMGKYSPPAEPRSEAGSGLQPPAECDLTMGGDRLAPNVAEFYETRFGRDFSGVRVHSGERALDYNDAVNAYAFTYGSHIWLGQGVRQQPSHILAHELAHVVQQTQPPPLASASTQPDLLPSPKNVQRYQPYWTPRDRKFDSHRFILPHIGAENSIFTEAPVPNANRRSTGEGGEVIEGRADLYKATKDVKEAKTVGLWFAGDKSPKNLPAHSTLQHSGRRWSRHGVESAPQADEARRSVIRARLAPDHIWIGELKPSHGSEEAHEGRNQLEYYKKGFLAAQAGVNSMPADKTDADWPTLGIRPISVEVPEMFKSPSDTNQQSRPLMIVHNQVIYLPLTPVMGKVHVAKSPEGGDILNYTWEPDSAVGLSVPARRAGHVRGARGFVRGLGEVIRADLVHPLRQSPIQGARKARPKPSPSGLTPAPPRIQARGRGTAVEDVKDSFDQTRFDKWNADRRRLSEKDKPALEKTVEFKEAKLEALALEDRQAAIKSGFRFPAISATEKEHLKSIDQIEFWTNPKAAVLGKLRYHFGGAFVKVANAYYSIRARFQNLLKDKQGVPKKGGLLGTVIRIAFEVLKAAGRVMVERTAQHLVNSLRKGVEQKLKSLIPEDKIEEFEAKVSEIEALADDLEQRARETMEALVEKTVGPYMKHIEAISEVADKLSTVTDVVSKVRWGARVIACLSPPGWGCLWILAESVMEKFASWLVDNCWFKKEIAPLVTDIEFITNLPIEMAKFIVDGIKGFLPDKFQDVFADINPDQIKSQVSTSIPSHEICDKNDYPTRRDRALIEKLALAELRKEIGEEKWQAWIKLGELYGVNRGDFLTEEQIVQLKRELKKADLASLREAADRYPAVQPGSHLTNLTAFLEEFERVKEEMYGSGGTGGDEGGAGGISVSVSEKPVKGDYKPTKHKFEVVGGVTRGQYKGQVIKVDVAALINGTTLTLRDVEARVGDRDFIPNLRNPEKVVVRLEVTRDQHYDIEKTHGAEVVKKVVYRKLEYKKGTRLRPYTLQLKAGKAEQ